MKKKISLAIVFLMVISALNSAVFAAEAIWICLRTYTTIMSVMHMR